MIEVLLSCRASPSDAGPTIDFDLTDSLGQTPLGLALWGGLRDVAVKLLHYGADVDQTDSRGFTLLHQVPVYMPAALWSKIEKNRQNSHPIIHCPTSEGVSEVSERANE